MRYTIILVAVMVVLGGCSNRQPRPSNVAQLTLHEYVISVTDQSSIPVEGARLNLSKSDLGLYWKQGKQPKSVEVAETGASGVITARIATELVQHWKGGYYNKENEAELLRQAYPHGGKDIWGHLTELRIGGEIEQRVVTTFTQNDAPVSLISVPIKVTAPSNLAMPSQHTYQFRAVDKEGVPVVGARVVANVADHAISMGNRQRLQGARKKQECITNSDGLCSVSLPVKMIVHYRADYAGEPAHKLFDHLYRINYSEAYFGYLSSVISNGALGSFFLSSADTTVQATLTGSEPELSPIKIQVPTPRDYYCDELKQANYEKFAGKLDVWVRTIKLSGDNRNAELEQICYQPFKGKNYIALTFQHKTKFNELKLNNYGIGVLVFDEVVRKLLDPIASASNSLLVDGYKLTVRTQKSNFVDKASPTEYLKYDFFMPKDLVRQYKQSDISGQKLVNGSIVLLDGERIDLDLK